MAVNIFSQKVITKSLNSKAEKVIIEFNIIDKIDLITSNDENMIFVVVESENEIIPRVSLKEENGIIFIKSNEKFEDENSINLDKSCSIQPNYSSYKIRVPKNKKLDISFTNGNFYATGFIGDLNLKIEEGIVKVNDFKGSVFVHINLGNVHFEGIRDTELSVTSNLGLVSSDLEMINPKKGKNYLKGVYQKSINQLRVNAILANIHLTSSMN